MLGFFNNKWRKDIPQYEDLFNGDIERVWARHIVLSEIKAPDNGGIWCDSAKHVRIVIVGSDSLSLNIVRNLALLCHYPNFDDEKEINRTIITIVSPNSNGRYDVEATKDRLESMTGFLLSECVWRCVSYGAKTVEWKGQKNNSFIDLEFEFIGLDGIDVNSYITDKLDTDANEVVSVIDNSQMLSEQTVSWIENHFHQYYGIDENVLRSSVTDCSIDVRRAQVVNMLYEASCHLEDVYVSDLYKVAAYKTALESFCLHTSAGKRKSSWNKIKDVSLKVSSLCCADFIDTKIRCAKAGGCDMRHLNGTELERFARSEHTRWNVEKLISGFRPYTPQERYVDERLYTDPAKMKAARKRMKTEFHAHIDICSCKELIRVDFESYKYDCFLTLAADDIIRIC